MLREEYDERQSWLPFVTAMLLSEKEPQRQPRHRLPDRQQLEKQWRVGFASVPAASRVLYRYARGVEQIVLPFPQWQRVLSGEVGQLERNGWPGFERVPGGGTATVRFAWYVRNDLLHWLSRARLRGRFHLTDSQIIFEHASDMARAMCALDTLMHEISEHRSKLVVMKARRSGSNA